MVQAVNQGDKISPRGARGAKGRKPLAPLGRLADAFEPKVGGNLPPLGHEQRLDRENWVQGEAPFFLRAPLGLPPENEAKGSQGEEVDRDDRVQCQNCLFFKQDMVTERMPVETWDKLVRVNHPALRWMFELVKVTDGWASVTYARKACHGGEPAPMPPDLKHRCDYFNPLNQIDNQELESNQKQDKEWWE